MSDYNEARGALNHLYASARKPQMPPIGLDDYDVSTQAWQTLGTFIDEHTVCDGNPAVAKVPLDPDGEDETVTGPGTDPDPSPADIAAEMAEGAEDMLK